MNSSKYYSINDPVAICALDSYEADSARLALSEALERIDEWKEIKEGSRVIIKANLVSAMKPDEAATTHPVLLSALTEMLLQRGCEVVIGDSPGGMYNAAFVTRVYRASGMYEVENVGAKLNMDFSERSAVFEDARVLHTFAYTGYLDECDLIINFSKLKSHGMMGMSAAAKNMFGAIPGVIKPEYHYRFPRYEDFADMIVDLDEYFHPVISICDAVVGMEGNGPTAGVPKQMGFVLASHSPHNLDRVAADLLGLTPDDVPTLAAAIRRGLTTDRVEEITVFGDREAHKVPDFQAVVEHRSLQFSGDGKNPIKRLFGKLAGAILKTRPVLMKDACVGCGVCKNVCPAKAIEIKDGKAVINRSECIRCFCCQEFCPKSAMKVKRTAIAALFHREKRK